MDKSQYKNVFVFCEQREGKLQNVALELLGKAHDLAQDLNQEVYAMLLGHNVKELAGDLIAHGADKVLVVDDECLATYTTEPYAQAIYQIICEQKPSIVLIGATTIGRDLGPRLSARVTTGLTADCTKLEISEEKELWSTRLAFGGNLMATIVCPDHRPQMSTVRPGVMKAMEADAARKGEVIDYKVNFDKSKFKVKVLETVKATDNMVDISEAKILISGGRGVGVLERFCRVPQDESSGQDTENTVLRHHDRGARAGYSKRP